MQTTSNNHMFKIKTKMIKFLKRVFKFFGIQVQKIEKTAPYHLENQSLISPILINYVPNKNGVVISADIQKGRGLPIYSYGNEGGHPFSVAARMAKNLSPEKQYAKILEVLSIYYTSVLPKSAGELALTSNMSVLHTFPVWSIVMPWENKNIAEWKKMVEDSVIFENSVENSVAGIEKGWAWIGPVHDDKLHIEAKRLTRVLQSVQSHGYKRHDEDDGDITAHILVDEQNEWVWQSIAAQHRASVLSALGWEKVPLRVTKVIRRQDAEFWPNVLNSTYTKSEALAVFDMVFNGSFSHITTRWDEYLNQIEEINER